MEISADETGSNRTVMHENFIPEVSFRLKSLLDILRIAFVRLKSFCSGYYLVLQLNKGK